MTSQLFLVINECRYKDLYIVSEFLLKSKLIEKVIKHCCEKLYMKFTKNNPENQICSPEGIYSKELAEIYDAIVYGKDEAYAEAEELDFIIKNLLPDNTKKILDLGCGVGKFLVPLTSMNYEVTGVDISKAVLDECRIRLKKQKLNACLINQSADEIDFSSQFDAVICLDSVICYLKSPEKIIKTLKNVRKALKPGGKFFIENRNLISDLDFYSKPNVDIAETKTTKITYTSKNRYDKNTSLYYIDINADVVKNDRNFSFVHSESLRFIPPEEMINFLKIAGFDIIKFLPDYEEKETDENEIISFVFIAEKFPL